MNIEGNEVVWKEKDIAITKTRKGFSIHKQVTTKNEDETYFCFWSCIDSFDNLDAAIEFAKNINL